jgi:hypothetical protein
MNHNHIHCGCNHSLVLCEVCDTVYCSKCGKEWSHYYTYSGVTSPYTVTIPPYVGTITYDINSAGNLVPVQNVEVHTHKCP